MNELSNQKIIDGSKLGGEHYFNDLLQQARQQGLLDDQQLARIQMAILQLLADQCDAYNRHASSSVRTEVAESLYESLTFIISFYLKSLSSPEEAVQLLLHSTLPELYRKGQNRLKVRFQSTRHIWLLTLENKLDTPHHAYKATVCESGLGVFFEKYDQRYQAHENPCSIDYQLACPVKGVNGLEYIRCYIERLYHENQFCQLFTARAIHRLLLGYDKNYWLLLINIFQLVLSSAVGCVLCGRDPLQLVLNKNDVLSLQQKLALMDREQAAMLLQQAANALLDQLQISAAGTRSYVLAALPEIEMLVHNAVVNNCLPSIIIIAEPDKIEI